MGNRNPRRFIPGIALKLQEFSGRLVAMLVLQTGLAHIFPDIFVTATIVFCSVQNRHDSLRRSMRNSHQACFSGETSIPVSGTVQR